ncbi:AAA family ATPase [Streptomyces sp. NPDC051018]|uniref:ATP-binding protein n=1 Tax=Streptomyces sp. NPDC051018 TaxID=3365639 RepID=UPI00379508F9
MTPALIGRDHPAGVLLTGIDRATESHGGLVLVTGEAGIGKTSLVTHAADEARRRGALVLGGSCWDSESAPGYWPWVQVVRGLRRGTSAEEWADAEKATGGRLATLLGEDPNGRGEGGESFAMYDAVTTALVTASQRRPVVVVLDDLHWADPASLKLLEFAAQHAWFERLLLIGTYRDAEVETADHPLQELIVPLAARAATNVTLTGLGRDEVAALLTTIAGSEPESVMVDEVHRRSGGNPFFVEQTARIWSSGAPVTTVAPGVREAVRRRLALLPEAVGGLLETAAVLGREFHRQVLAAVASAPVPHVDRLLSRAVAARLVAVRDGGRFAFAHDLVRETLYDALDEPRIRDAHASVVRALDDAPALSGHVLPADLARHAYLAGGELERAQRVDLLMAAARDASGRLASEEAIGHYRRALEASGDDSRRAALISLDLGSHLLHHGEREEAWDCYERAIALAREVGEPGLLARVAISVHQHCFSPEDALRMTERSGELLREAHRALIGGGESGKPEESGESEESRQNGKSGESRENGENGERLAGLTPEQIAQDLAVRTTALARDEGDDDALSFALWARHDSIWGLGTATERLTLTDEMATVARRTGNRDMELHASSMRWVTLLELGDPRYLDQVRAFATLAERSALRRFELARAVDLSLVAALNGRFTEAMDLLSETGWGPVEEGAFGYVTAQMQWSLFMVQGRLDEARTVLDGLDGRDGATHPYPQLLAGLTAVERGDTALALRLSDELSALPGRLPRLFAPLEMRLRAQVAAAAGDETRIEAARAAFTPYAGQWVISIYGCDISGPVDLWLGLLDAAQGRRDAAVTALTAAYTSADRLRARPWSIRARAALARVLGPDAPPDLTEDLRRSAEELRLTPLPAHRDDFFGGAGVPGAASGEAARQDPASGGAASAVTGPGGPAVGPATRGVTTSPVGAMGPAAGARAVEAAMAGRPGGQDGGPTVPGRAAGVGGSGRTAGHDGGPTTQPAVAAPQFRRDGTVWALAFQGRSVHVPDAKGLRDLHTLLAHTGEELSAVSLLAPEGGETVAAARRFGGDPVLDEEAKTRYRQRLEQLDEEIDRAAERGDDRRAAEYSREREALLDELRTAAGLGGRTRRLGDEAERARKTVTARIRDTLRKLDTLHPELAAHLRDSVTTGAYCAYRPATPLDWRLSR